MARTFFEYTLKPDGEDAPAMLCIGERMKKGTFRPCITTIPCSTITGALRAYLGRDDIIAVGFFNQAYLDQVDEQGWRRVGVYAPRDSVAGVSKLPLTIEYLTHFEGKVYVLKTERLSEPLPNIPLPNVPFRMGAMKSVGFGRCQMVFDRTLEEEDLERMKRGRLRSRVYAESKEDLDTFGIGKVEKPYYGYLFKPTSPTSGYYALSLMEGSIVEGPKFLVEVMKHENKG